MAETRAELEDVFCKCCNLFKSGRIQECMENLGTLTFKKFCLLELGQQNNILICRYVNKKRSMSTNESIPQQGMLQAFETLHQKIQGIPVTIDDSDIQLLIAYNVCCLHLMSLDTSNDMKPDMTLMVNQPSHVMHNVHLRQVCHLSSKVMRDVFLKWLRLHQQNIDSSSDEDVIVRQVISVLDSSQMATESREEICLLLCLHSLTLILKGQRSEAREHMEALSAIHIKPDHLHIVATSGDERRELRLTEIMFSLLSIIYFSYCQWDKCLSVLTRCVRGCAVYMHAYVLYEQRQTEHAVTLLNDHINAMSNQVASISLNLLGCCLGAQGKLYSAIEMLKRAALDDPFYPTPIYNMSLQYRKLGLYDAELEALNLLVVQLRNSALSSKKTCTVDMCSDRVYLSLAQHSRRELKVTQAMYTLCKRCLELQRYHDAAAQYKALLTLLHLGHTTRSSESCHLPGIAMATIYVETAYSLLCCGEFTDTITVCQHLTGRPEASVATTTGHVEHVAAIMYEVCALVRLGCFDAALSAVDKLIDLISPAVTATLAENESPSPSKRSRSNGHSTKHHNMCHLLENAYIYKSLLLLKHDQTRAALKCSRLAMQLNTGEPEVMYNHTLLLFKLQRTSEACTIWSQYRDITKSSHHPHLCRNIPGSELLSDLNESAFKNLDDICTRQSCVVSNDVGVIMNVM